MATNSATNLKVQRHWRNAGTPKASFYLGKAIVYTLLVVISIWFTLPLCGWS